MPPYSKNGSQENIISLSILVFFKLLFYFNYFIFGPLEILLKYFCKLNILVMTWYILILFSSVMLYP